MFHFSLVPLLGHHVIRSEAYLDLDDAEVRFPRFFQQSPRDRENGGFSCWFREIPGEVTWQNLILKVITWRCISVFPIEASRSSISLIFIAIFHENPEMQSLAPGDIQSVRIIPLFGTSWREEESANSGALQRRYYLHSVSTRKKAALGQRIATLYGEKYCVRYSSRWHGDWGWWKIWFWFHSNENPRGMRYAVCWTSETVEIEPMDSWSTKQMRLWSNVKIPKDLFTFLTWTQTHQWIVVRVFFLSLSLSLFCTCYPPWNLQFAHENGWLEDDSRTFGAQRIFMGFCC